MANYIISLDSSTHANAGAAELAITNAGLAITKTYPLRMVLHNLLH